MTTQGDAIVDDAKTWLGVPYLYGGCSRGGVDCSCYVKNVFQETLGINLPRTTDTQAQVGKVISDLSSALPGDVCYFGPAGSVGSGTNGHCGIYVGGGMMLNAPHQGTVVRYDAVSGFTGSETLTAIRRFWDDSGLPPGTQDTTTTGGTSLLAATNTSVGGHCAFKITLPGSGLPIIGSSVPSICLFEEGWGRAFLGGLLLVAGGAAIITGMILLGTEKTLKTLKPVTNAIGAVR